MLLSGMFRRRSIAISSSKRSEQPDSKYNNAYRKDSCSGINRIDGSVRLTGCRRKHGEKETGREQHRRERDADSDKPLESFREICCIHENLTDEGENDDDPRMRVTGPK